MKDLKEFFTDPGFLFPFFLVIGGFLVLMILFVVSLFI